MKIAEIQELYREASDYWKPIYDKAKEDLNFSVGIGHWKESDKKARKNRPCHTINLLPQFIHQVANDMRQNTPSINVLPVGDGSDKETAEKLKGLIRNIEYESLADEVYDTAGEYSVKCSIGWIRVDHDYEDEDSFTQKLYLKSVRNPLAVYIDPNSTECDGCDAEYGFVIDKISVAKFKRLYKGKKAVSFESEDVKMESDREVTIAEFFKKEYNTVTKIQLADGSIVNEEELTGPVMGAKRRQMKQVTIRRYKVSGADVLHETTFPGKYIPLVPVYGEEVWIDGQRHLLSLIRQSKDAQRKYNHWASKESEILGLQPISPVMAPFGSTEDDAENWQRPGNAMVLRYKQYNTDGTPLDRPQRLDPPVMSPGVLNAMAGAKEDVKATMGLYNASIGDRSNETSGRAILARKQEGDVATFHFADNRNRSITHVGRILVNAIPTVYDTQRIVRIIGKEDEPEMVGINGALVDEKQEHSYFMKFGKYDVRVSTGPSYTTKRNEAAAFMSEMMQANPNLMKVAGDLMIKYLDIPGADDLAARVKKTIPPELLEESEEQGAPTPREQQMAQVIQEMEQQMQEMGKALQDAEQAQADRRSDEVKLQMEAEKNERDAALKEQELAQDYAIDTRKQNNEEAKIAIEAAKVDLEARQGTVSQSIDGPSIL